MEGIRRKIGETGKSVGNYLLACLKWLAAAGVLGAICGGAGVIFHKTIDFATDFRMEHTWLVWFLPLAGLLTFALYRLCKVELGAGTNLVFQSVKDNRHVPILLASLIYIGTTLSHLFGASVGREGAALQLGGSIGHNFGELFRFNEEDVRTLSMCGMAACFSALFGTPLTAAVFVMEVIMVGYMGYNALLPTIIAAYSAYGVAVLLGVEPLSFTLAQGIPALSALSVVQTAGLAALCGLLGIVFCVSIHKAGHFSEKWIKNPYIRIAAGGLLMAVVTTIFGLYDYNGAGTHMIRRAIEGEAQPWAFAVKLLLTALCVGVGFRGGEIVPTLFIGSTFGCVAGGLLGMDPGFGAAVGMVALFCSAVNCPIASLFLAVELFGTADLPLFAIAVAVSFVLSGYFGLYNSQKIIFSKIRQKVVDISTK